MFNPFARGYVEHIGGYTVRDVQPELTKRSRKYEGHSILFEEVLTVLEQTDFCDFEVRMVFMNFE